MKVKKRKKDNNKKIIIAILLVVSALGGYLFWNHQQSKYVASVKTGEKKAENAYATDEYVLGVNKNKIPNETAQNKCMNAISAIQVRVINNAIIGDDEISDDEQITNVVDGKNLHFIINCVPKTGAFSRVGAGDTFKFKIASDVSGAPLTFSCGKNATSINPSQLKFDRTSASVKKIVITNKDAFNVGNTNCPADGVKITYNLQKVSGGRADDQIESDKNNGTVTDDDGSKINVNLEGSYTVEDNDEETTISESSSSDDAQTTDAQNLIIANADDAKISKYEVVARVRSFTKFEEEYNKAESSRKMSFDIPADGDALSAEQKSKIATMTCNYKLTRKQVETIEQQNKRSLIDRNGNFTDYYYDAENTHYYKATRVKTTDIPITYIYHSIPKTKKVRYRTSKDKKIKCTKTCTEIVKVEYGPPVQVAGGMCFEYRVKVSSIVKCKVTDVHVDKPEKQSKYCKLTPHCSHGLKQGGPTEEFEACVQVCDGGKYSEKCSNKCYNEVYGGNLSFASVEETLFSSSNTAPEDYVYNKSDGEPKSDKGKMRGQYYYDTSSKRYDWCPTYTSGLVKITNNGSPSTKNSTKRAAEIGYIGVWYYIQKYKTHWYNDEYQSDKYGRGFIRARYDNGKQCTDSCGWYVGTKGCDTTSYFAFNYNVSNKRNKNGSVKSDRCPKMYVYNYKWDDKAKKWVEPSNDADKKYVLKKVCTQEDLILYDYLNNKKKLKNKIKNSCNSQVTCTTSTAEYNIRFKYQNSETKEIVSINYPYDVRNLTKDSDTEINKEYKKETLISNTTQHGKKYNIDTVFRYGGCYRDASNQNWYLTEWTFPGTWITSKRLSTGYGDKPGNNYTIARGSVCLPLYSVDTNAEWAQYFIDIKTNKDLEVDKNKWKFSGEDYSKKTINGYNILATTKSFGFFKWDFKITCFYALKASTDICLDPPCTTTDTELRSIDTSDPFLQNMTSSSKNIEDSTGKKIEEKKREIGFNWTKDATLAKFTTGGYNQNPEELTKYIMSTDTFSENNLDYEVTLTPDDLKYIREQNKRKTYNELLNDKMKASDYYNEKNGVSHYYSKLLKHFGLSVNNCNNKYCNVRGGQ